MCFIGKDNLKKNWLFAEPIGVFINSIILIMGLSKHYRLALLKNTPCSSFTEPNLLLKSTN